MDPWSWVMLRVGPRWLWVLLLLSACFWGFVLGALLRWWRKSRAVLRHRVLVRAPGSLYCPECAKTLSKGANAKGVGFFACPTCAGKWTASASLKEWTPLPPAAGSIDVLPCPACSAPMEGGHVLGKSFTVRRCAACSGYWMSRIDWVSFELGL